MTDEEIQATIDYMQTLKITQGPEAGKNLKLLPWQKSFIKDIYKPGIKTAALSVPRGNGKTTLIAALGAAAFAGPAARPGTEVVIVAGTFQQAKLAFTHLHYFIDPIIGKRTDWRVTNNTQGAEINHLPSRRSIKVKSANPKGAHGLAPTMVICDEPAQWPENYSEAMVAAMLTGMGKQGDELMVALGTRPADPDHWFQKWLDGDADIGFSYHAGEESDFLSDECFMQVNPSAKYMPNLVAAGMAERDKARESDEFLASYKSLRLNMGTRDIKSENIVSIEDWQRCETEDLPDRGGPCIWGVDLGGAAAMSAISAYWPITGRLEVIGAFPDFIPLDERGTRDNVGDRYIQMRKRGELITLPGRVIRIADLMRVAYETFGTPSAVCADRWKQAELLDGLDEAGVPAALFSPRGEGYKDGGEDSRLFVTAVQTGKVKIAPSLLMRSAIAGAVMITDPAGNRKLSRMGDGTTRKSKHRDDALAASMKSVSEGLRNKTLQAARNSVSLEPMLIQVA